MYTSVLLERDAELAELGAGVERLRLGESTFAAVVGPAGVGKSQLLEHVRVLAAETAAWVLRARGSELEREFAYGLVRQLFELPLARASAEERSQWLAGPASAAISVLGGGTPSDVAPGEFAVLNGLFWLVSNMCDSGPIVMIVDDLHWADEPSLRFLAFLLPRLEDLELLLVTGLRPFEPGAAVHLLDLITLDPICRKLFPACLTVGGVNTLLATVLSSAVEPAFAEACHRLTGGNALWLATLADGLKDEHVEPVSSRIEQMEDIGSQALSRRVGMELGRLSDRHIRLAQAISVLGPSADLSHIANLTALPPGDAGEYLGDLERVGLIQNGAPSGTHSAEFYEFTHPLVRTVVYEDTDFVHRDALHRQAAALLEGDSSAEHVAAHLLRLVPVGDLRVVSALRRAAAGAIRDNAPEAAHRYLRRALAEPPPAEQRLELLSEAALAALPVDLNAATAYLRYALALTDDVGQRANLSSGLGLAMLYVGQVDEAVDLLTKTIDALPLQEDELRRAVGAILLNAPTVAADWQSMTLRLPQLRALRPAETLGALQLDCVIATLDAFAGDPKTAVRARRALSSPSLIESATQGVSTGIAGYFAQTAADPDDAVIAAFDDLVGRARVRGALSSLCPAHTLRGLVYLRRGHLAEAESELEQALRLAELTGLAVAVPVILGVTAEVLVDQGRIDEAETLLGPTAIPIPLPTVGLYFFPLQARARLLHARGDHKEAVDTALAAGRRFADHGGNNPAIVAWRSQAALSLHALGRHEEALSHASTEVTLAQRWGAPHALGHALRIAGRITPGPGGLQLLQEAVDILRRSSARLEYAHALVDLGAALRRNNARTAARTPLMTGMELADRCGAAYLAETARVELRAAGARPRSTAITGPDALTPSERRVAELAARGLPNRRIAQELFVTTKTVEVHLSASYRKLGINTRAQLPQALMPGTLSVNLG